MRRALGARRATLSGPRTRGFLISVPGILALLHPAAATSKPPAHLVVASKTSVGREAPAGNLTPPNHRPKTKKRTTHAGDAQPGTRVSPATKSATGTASAQYKRSNHAGHATPRAQAHVATPADDSSKLVIPQGDGSPVLSIAAHYLGRPYQFGSEGNAFDCSGFVRTVFADMGVDLPHSAREISAFGDRVARDELEPGDLVFFRDADHHYATHVGIYVGDDKFVHAARRGGQVQVDSLTETYYTQHYFCAKRIEI